MQMKQQYIYLNHSVPIEESYEEFEIDFDVNNPVYGICGKCE